MSTINSKVASEKSQGLGLLSMDVVQNFLKGIIIDVLQVERDLPIYQMRMCLEAWYSNKGTDLIDVIDNPDDSWGSGLARAKAELTNISKVIADMQSIEYRFKQAIEMVESARAVEQISIDAERHAIDEQMSRDPDDVHKELADSMGYC